jgi:hypothetical protein
MISYTMPCHKRQSDLDKALDALRTAIIRSPEHVEIVVADYGNSVSLTLSMGVRRVLVTAPYYHMAHARNVGIRAARGNIVCAFVADQIVAPKFFSAIWNHLRPGTFLTWEETFVCYRDDLIAAGGFDERFELYGPEGKELTERLQRRGLYRLKIPKDSVVTQLPTSYKDKISNYAQKFTRREMHHIGMDTWAECSGQLVANAGKPWGGLTAPEYRTYSNEYLAEIRERIQANIREHEEKMKAMVTA